MRLPKQGKGERELFEALERFREDDMPWRSGRTWAYVYDPGPEAEAVIQRAFGLYLTENGLDPTVFPSAMKLENDVIGIAARLLHGDEEVVGSFTSGGTESIFCAVKAARDRAREQRPELTAPEILLPETAHASFQKAAHYLGLTPVVVPVEPETFLAVPERLREAITPNTAGGSRIHAILLDIGSDPNIESRLYLQAQQVDSVVSVVGDPKTAVSCIEGECRGNPIERPTWCS